MTLRKLDSEERRPSKQIADRLAEVLQVPPDERADFLRFARGDPFAAPAVPAANTNLTPGTASANPPAPHASEAAEAPEAGSSPFKGLRYFDEADAQLYFGREALIHKLVARLLGQPDEASHQSRFLAIVGASGSGKSSVVRAGMIPALKENGQ